jgi:hypothetical protein
MQRRWGLPAQASVRLQIAGSLRSVKSFEPPLPADMGVDFFIDHGRLIVRLLHVVPKDRPQGVLASHRPSCSPPLPAPVYRRWDNGAVAFCMWADPARNALLLTSADLTGYSFMSQGKLLQVSLRPGDGKR